VSSVVEEENSEHMSHGELHRMVIPSGIMEIIQLRAHERASERETERQTERERERERLPGGFHQQWNKRVEDDLNHGVCCLMVASAVGVFFVMV
jgi:hypothetical protein